MVVIGYLLPCYLLLVISRELFVVMTANNEQRTMNNK